jgi:hypothetical protein
MKGYISLEEHPLTIIGIMAKRVKEFIHIRLYSIFCRVDVYFPCTEIKYY